MAYIDWSDALSVGFAEVDNDHQKLVGIVNNIHEALETKPDMDTIADQLEELLSYTSWHFRHEERLMQECSYEELFSHKEEHEDLVAQATGLYETYLGGDETVPDKLLPFLREWLSRHITVTDKKMGDFLAANAG